MRRLFKILAWLIATVLLLLVVAAVAVTLFFDPNDYRDTITGVVKKQTGRDLTIGGDIDLSLFPWLGVEINQVQLSNASGFEPEAMARVEEAQLRVALLPLLRQEVQVDTVVLDGLRLHLARNAEGVTNWDDLIPEAAPKREPKPEPRDRDLPVALAVGGLAIRDAEVTWSDATTGLQAAAHELSLTSGALELGEPFPLSFETRIEANQPQLSGRIALDAKVMVNLDAQQYVLDDLVLTTDLASPELPGGRLDAELATSLSADLKAGTATIPEIRLTALGTRLEGSVQASSILAQPDANGRITLEVTDAEQLLAVLGEAAAGIRPAALKGAGLQTQFAVSLGNGTATIDELKATIADLALSAQAKVTELLAAPKVEGHAELAPFVPRDIMQAFGVPVPEAADPSALTKAALATDFSAGTDAVAVRNLKAQLDDTTLTGEAAVSRFAAPTIRFDLLVDAIDIDRYLPPPQEGEAKPRAKGPGTPGGAAAQGAAELPLDTLRSLDILGTARIGKLKAANLQSTDVHATVKANNGLFRVNPAGAQLYGGTYAGNLTFDVRKEVPRIAMDERLSGVQSGPLLADLMGEPYVTGTANLSAKLSARGLEVDRIKRTLSGEGGFQFANGAVNGINVAALIRAAMAKIKGQPAPAEEPAATDFAELKGTFTAKNGVVRNGDLSAKSPLLRIEGEGTANLPEESLDYLVRTAIVGTLEGQGGQEIQELRNLTIPVRIQGPFADPKISVELDKVLEARAKQALDREKRKAKKQLEEEKQQLEQKLEEQLKDKLKLLR